MSFLVSPIVSAQEVDNATLPLRYCDDEYTLVNSICRSDPLEDFEGGRKSMMSGLSRASGFRTPLGMKYCSRA